MRRKLHRTAKQSADRLKKLRALREKSRRLTKKVANLETVIAELKAKNLVSEEDGDLLESIDPVNKDFLKKYLCPSVCGRKYSPALRKFALCLNFISPRAYKYVKECFNTCLPHPSTLTTWYRSVDANPGFTTESLNCIQLLAKRKDKQLYCALSMDEMAIRRHVQWDGEKCVGLVNYGEALDGHGIAEAREALVFMVTCVNDGWKIPVGYFLIDGCNGEQKANLVKQCICLLINCGINVLSLTFDGCPANFKMAQNLGCSFEHSENIHSFFQVDGHDIVIVPDPAHMLKLVRNTLGQKKELINARGEKISWQFIENLHNLQENEGLHFANRLKKQHIDFNKQIMKVKLAAQTFSNSVADAIQYCDQDLNLPEFFGSYATVEFITKINNLFDILNSRNINAYGFKKPMNEKNANQILDFLFDTEKYIRGLNLEGTNILTTNRKVGFLGLLICIQSLKKIYDDNVSTGKLKFLSFYKFSQDHLEYFFSSIRSKGGFNNNPTAFQFQSAYKKLVVHGEIKSITSGNCIPLEEIKILTHTEVCYEKKLNAYTKCTNEVENHELEHSNQCLMIESDHDYLADPSRLSI